MSASRVHATLLRKSALTRHTTLCSWRLRRPKLHCKDVDEDRRRDSPILWMAREATRPSPLPMSASAMSGPSRGMRIAVPQDAAARGFDLDQSALEIRLQVGQRPPPPTLHGAGAAGRLRLARDRRPGLHRHGLRAAADRASRVARGAAGPRPHRLFAGTRRGLQRTVAIALFFATVAGAALAWHHQHGAARARETAT